MILGKVKAFAAAAVAAVIAILYALLQREKRERLEDELGDEQAARAVEAKAHRAVKDGLEKEKTIREKNHSDIKPGRFS